MHLPPQWDVLEHDRRLPLRLEDVVVKPHVLRIEEKLGLSVCEKDMQRMDVGPPVAVHSPYRELPGRWSTQNEHLVGGGLPREVASLPVELHIQNQGDPQRDSEAIAELFRPRRFVVAAQPLEVLEDSESLLVGQATRERLRRLRNRLLHAPTRKSALRLTQSGQLLLTQTL